MTYWLAALIFVFGSCLGGGLVLWYVQREVDQPSRVFIGDFKGTEVWAERDGRLWWRLWMVKDDRRAALHSPFHYGNPGKWVSLNEARELALRCGTVERLP